MVNSYTTKMLASKPMSSFLQTTQVMPGLHRRSVADVQVNSSEAVPIDSYLSYIGEDDWELWSEQTVP